MQLDPLVSLPPKGHLQPGWLWQNSTLPGFVIEQLDTQLPHLTSGQRLMGMVLALKEISARWSVCAVRPEKGKKVEHLIITTEKHFNEAEEQNWSAQIDQAQCFKSQGIPDEYVHELWTYSYLPSGGRNWKRMVQSDQCFYDLNALAPQSVLDEVIPCMVQACKTWMQQIEAPECRLVVRDGRARAEYAPQEETLFFKIDTFSNDVAPDYIHQLLMPSSRYALTGILQNQLDLPYLIECQPVFLKPSEACMADRKALRLSASTAQAPTRSRARL